MYWIGRGDRMPLDKPFPFETIGEEEVETSRTYSIDWENGRIGGFVDGLEAVLQFIKKALITPRFKCLIYDSQYGSEIKENLMDKDASHEYIETELPFLVEDALLHDGRILKVYNMEIEFGEGYPAGDSVWISFEADTIYGKAVVEEMV